MTTSFFHIEKNVKVFYVKKWSQTSYTIYKPYIQNFAQELSKT
jgi:hypothetical protein